MSKEELYILIEKYLAESLTPDEKVRLAGLVEQPEHFDRLAGLIYDELRAGAFELERDEQVEQRIKEYVLRQISTEEEPAALPGGPVRRLRWRTLAAAASVLLFIGLGAYLIFFNRKNVSPPAGQPVAVTDIPAPDRSKASITLADGSVVYLDSAANGQLVQQGNMKLVKLGNGRIAYQTTDGSSSPLSPGREAAYNTLTNPRGSKVIDMTLSDGSHVWLNAGSGITYPVAFSGNERKVTMTGEAYFEITHSVTASGAKQSFIVEKNDMQVTVLGTHFNVNAYDDEGSIKVTLLEGSVKTSNSFGDVMLRPGQQATITKSQKPETRNNIDLEQVMAWKHGLFNFEGLTLADAMRQIARWYDIEVVYEQKPPAIELTGEMTKDVTLKGVLIFLDKMDVRYRMDGRKLFIR